jgi:SAM-dependent methyltransferase
MLAVRQRLSGLLDDSDRPEPELVFDGVLKRWSGKLLNEEEPWWLKTRRIELVLVQALLEGISLDGALTLDVGAGFGSDSSYYAARGARIVALEPNFGMLAQGSQTYRHFQWIGGSADALPIADESMDFVTANASLHHHLNVRTSLDEMLRVLKPGGAVITACDSVRGSTKVPLEEDHKHWDTDPNVLAGVNEQILRLDVLVDKLSSYGDGIEAELLLHEGNGELRRWTLEDAVRAVQERPKLWAILGMRIRKLRSLRTPVHRMRRGRVSSVDLARVVLGDDERAAGYQLLGQLLDPGDLRSRAPLGEANRFLQLNGWRWPLPEAEWRLIYNRGRLFVPATAATRSVKAVFAVPAVDTRQDASVSLCLNGKILHQARVPRGQVQRWSCAVPPQPHDTPCALTIELGDTSDPSGSPYVNPGQHVAIQALELSEESPAGCTTGGLLRRASLLALCAEGLLTENVPVRLGCRAVAGLDALAWLRSLGVPARVVCDAAIWPFYAEQYRDARAQGEAKFAAGMSVQEARTHDATWLLDAGWAQDLRADDPFADQLCPPAATTEAKLRQDLEKTKAKVQELKGKLAKANSRATEPKRPSLARLLGKLGRLVRKERFAFRRNP